MTEEDLKPVDADELEEAIAHYRKCGKGQLGSRTVYQYKAVAIWLEQLRSYREGRGGKLPTHHDLKCWPEHFRAISRGSKRAELRLDDRHFKVGDVLRLAEYQRDTQPGEAFTGRFLEVRVLHILGASQFLDALRPNYVMMSISLPEIWGGTFQKDELPP
jgi:hypothetical protein